MRSWSHARNEVMLIMISNTCLLLPERLSTLLLHTKSLPRIRSFYDPLTALFSTLIPSVSSLRSCLSIPHPNPGAVRLTKSALEKLWGNLMYGNNMAWPVVAEAERSSQLDLTSRFAYRLHAVSLCGTHPCIACTLNCWSLLHERKVLTMYVTFRSVPSTIAQKLEMSGLQSSAILASLPPHG